MEIVSTVICSFANIEQLSERSLSWLGPISHLGFKGNIVFHEIHGSSIGNYYFTRIKFNLNNLHIITDKFKINFMAIHFYDFRDKFKRVLNFDIKGELDH
jgi:hypothetical protein